jgi:hypothetical protein
MNRTLGTAGTSRSLNPTMGRLRACAGVAVRPGACNDGACDERACDE